MTIADMRDKCKELVAKVPRDFLILAVLVLASSMSFGLGYLAGLEAGNDIQIAPFTPDGASIISDSGQVVASKSGTKYYFQSCSGADRISDSNKVRFVSEIAAREAGYTLAANCSQK